MRTFAASTPRQFRGPLNTYHTEVTLRAASPSAAIRRFALDLANTSQHSAFALLRSNANGKRLRCFKAQRLSDFNAYARVGYVADDGSKVCIPFEFLMLEDKGPLPCVEAA